MSREKLLASLPECKVTLHTAPGDGAPVSLLLYPTDADEYCSEDHPTLPFIEVKLDDVERFCAALVELRGAAKRGVPVPWCVGQEWWRVHGLRVEATRTVYSESVDIGDHGTLKPDGSVCPKVIWDNGEDCYVDATGDNPGIRPLPADRQPERVLRELGYDAAKRGAK